MRIVRANSFDDATLESRLGQQGERDQPRPFGGISAQVVSVHHAPFTRRA